MEHGMMEAVQGDGMGYDGGLQGDGMGYYGGSAG